MEDIAMLRTLRRVVVPIAIVVWLVLAAPAAVRAHDWPCGARSSHAGRYPSYGVRYGSYGYSSYGVAGRAYYYSPRGDSLHLYSSPSRIHYGAHGGYHTGPYLYRGTYLWGPHSGYHYDLHGAYGHFYGL
jgi:hypothetical protein